MADTPSPTPAEGHATVPRLGYFGGTNEPEPEEALIVAQIDAQRRRAVFQLVTLLLGVGSLVGGITALAGWPWGLITFGILCVVISVLVSVDFSRSNDDKVRGQ